MVTACKPKPEDLWFRQKLLADKETMSYNLAWGGTISFPEEKWAAWYASWMDAPETRRYYRYLYDSDSGEFVGEISYDYDPQENRYLCNVIVLAQFRRQGFGTAGMELLCRGAKANGISVLYDDIAVDNPSYKLFLKNGFTLVSRTDDGILVKREL